MDDTGALTAQLAAATVTVGAGIGFAVAGGIVVTWPKVLAGAGPAVAGTVPATGGRLRLRARRVAPRAEVAVLRVDGGEAPPVAVLGGDLVPGDPLWVGGRRVTHSGRTLLGEPGTPVLNLRTGAVCGMLGGAGMVMADTILEGCGEAELLLDQSPESFGPWLGALTDGQLRRGGWRFAGPRLRRYLRFASLTDVAGAMLPRAVRGPESARPVPAGEIFGHDGLVLLTGEPGLGKSTLLRSALAGLAARPPASADPVPVLIPASGLIDLGQRKLPELLAASAAEGRKRWPAAFFAAPPLPGSRWLVLVDGLDEVPDPNRLLAALRAQTGPYSFVIATRAPAADGYELLPLDPDEVSALARASLRDGLARRFPAAAGRSGLAGNPLMATMLCRLFAAAPDEPLPVTRPELYRRFVELLERQQYSGATGGLRAQVRARLERHGRGAEEAGERLVRAAAGLVGRLAYERRHDPGMPAVASVSTWTDELRPGPVSADEWRDLVGEVLRRGGLLIEAGGDLDFPHPTVREFLAARFSRSGATAADTDSYARFLIAARPGDHDLEGLADRPELLAGLVADGVAVPAGTVRAAWQRVHDEELPVRPVAALGTMARLDRRRTETWTAAAVADSTLGRDLRLLALDAFAQLRAGGRPGPPDERWRIPELAASDDRMADRVLRHLAADTTLLGTERWLAAEALRQPDLLARLAADESLDRIWRDAATRALAKDDVPGLRDRLARIGRRRSDRPVTELLEPLLDSHRRHHPRPDLALLQHAFDLAAFRLAGMRRSDGAPAVTHPLAVAGLLAEAGADGVALAAALLHDTAPAAAAAGAEVAGVVGGLDRASGSVPALVAAGFSDVRVLLVALACHLHDLRTLRHPSEATLRTYAPLAHHLGLGLFRRELEDLAFAQLDPPGYEEARARPARPELTRAAVEQVERHLAGAGVRGVVAPDVPHAYETHLRGGRHLAVTVAVETERDCYAVLSALHVEGTAVPGRFRDTMAPRYGLHRELRTAVRGPSGEPLSVRVRTHLAVHLAEYGVAAHWRDNGRHAGDGILAAGLRHLLDWQAEAGNARDYLDHLRFDAAPGIWVTGPDDRVHPLPAGATPVDLAYAVGTGLGHRCIGARVGGRIVPLDHKLTDGDRVEIYTSRFRTAAPTADWLEFVAADRSRARIRRAVAEDPAEETYDRGSAILLEALHKAGMPVAGYLTADSLLALTAAAGLPDGLDPLCAALADGALAPTFVTEFLSRR